MYDLKFLKPSVLFHKIIPQLHSVHSIEIENKNNSILLNDNQKEVDRKINKVAFSGGKNTIEEHRKFGGDVEIDVSCQYFNIFNVDDEKRGL